MGNNIMTFPSNIDTLRLGELLMVETKNEILVGVLKILDLNCNIIELNPVRDFITNYVYTSAQLLPLQQIKTIKVIEKSGMESEKSLTSASNNLTSSSSPSSSKSSTSTLGTAIPLSCSSLNLSSCQLKLIQDQISNTVYIYQTGQTYYNALADLKSQTVISLLLEPMGRGRDNRTSLMALGTFRAVYIFDVLRLGKVLRGIKEILESKRPRKVLHYGHYIFDNLKHQQNVLLDGGDTFDTFVAHCLLAGTKTHLNLLETIEYHLNISPLYFSEKCQSTTGNGMEKMDPYTRPLAKEHLRSLAKKAIWQLELYEHMLHEQMLSNFYQQCDQFCKTFSSNDDSVEVALQSNPHSRQGFQQISSTEWGKVLKKKL